LFKLLNYRETTMKDLMIGAVIAASSIGGAGELWAQERYYQ
jgi:hypothetical protein